MIHWMNNDSYSALMHGSVVITSITKDHDYISRSGQSGRIRYAISLFPFFEGGKLETCLPTLPWHAESRSDQDSYLLTRRQGALLVSSSALPPLGILIISHLILSPLILSLWFALFKKGKQTDGIANTPRLTRTTDIVVVFRDAGDHHGSMHESTIAVFIQRII